MLERLICKGCEPKSFVGDEKKTEVLIRYNLFNGDRGKDSGDISIFHDVINRDFIQNSKERS